MTKRINDITPEEWDSLRSAKLEWTEDYEDEVPLEEGIKHDQGKIRLDLIPVEAKEALGRVVTYGASKYADNNWRKGIAYSRLIAAMYRHLAMFEKGVDIDEESGLRHVDHALTNLAFLATFIEEGRDDLDDRYRR